MEIFHTIIVKSTSPTEFFSCTLRKNSLYIFSTEYFCRSLLLFGVKIVTIVMVISMELDYIKLGQRIAKRRAQAGIRQNVLADEIGISNNYLSSIERGKEKPSLEIIINICNTLHVTPDYLLMGNMYSNNIPQNIVDGLRLCSNEDLILLSAIMQHMVDRQGIKWNSDNFA